MTRSGRRTLTPGGRSLPDPKVRPLHLLRILAIASVAVLVPTACGGDDRPSVAEWRRIWDEARGLVPEPEELVDDGEDECGEALGELRARRERLVDTPRPVLEDSVSEWVGAVEGLLLECPHEEEEVAERFEEIRVLRAEVEAGLRAVETG